MIDRLSISYMSWIILPEDSMTSQRERPFLIIRLEKTETVQIRSLFSSLCPNHRRSTHCSDWWSSLHQQSIVHLSKRDDLPSLLSHANYLQNRSKLQSIALDVISGMQQSEFHIPIGWILPMRHLSVPPIAHHLRSTVTSEGLLLSYSAVGRWRLSSMDIRRSTDQWSDGSPTGITH